MLTDLPTITLADFDGGKLDVSSSETQHISSGKKRTIREDVDGETILTSKDPWEDKGRRAKKFRVEWMNEVYFKDWLRPHPTDETYCICIACDIRLRCGKSELEKHASGLKHCKRMDAMKENPDCVRVSLLTESAPGQVSALCDEENGTYYIAAGADRIDRLDDSFDNVAGTTGDSTTMQLTESAIAKSLLKLDKYLDAKSEMEKQKHQMLEIEHHRRMQVMNKELELRSLEVLVKQRELQKLNNTFTAQGSSKAVDDVNLLIQ